MNSPIITRSGAQKAKIQTRAMVKSNATSTSAAASLGGIASSSATSASLTSSGGSTNATNMSLSKSTAEARKPNQALLEAKRRARQLKMQNSTGNGGNTIVVSGGNCVAQQDAVTDIFQNAVNAKTLVRKPTALIYDESMSQHCCLWDDKHPECPERFIRVLERCRELNLPERCKMLLARKASKKEVMLLHSAEHYELLERTSGVNDPERMEDLSSQYDSIYIHPSTFQLSLLATGATIDLIDHVWQGKVQNGMAVIRPPGHHAMKAEFNGYCFFNNVSIATKHALDNLNAQKIMIIDWDVHHGQGTQRFFYDDPRVLYFSIHRFEHGTFWPNLKESDFDAIGEGAGKGYNFNVPLNRTGMGNGDYLAIFQQILIPVALEYQPEMIIISAGYDAALGCPEGEMEVTPTFYPHLLNPLLRLANSRIAVVLEGGYCLESLSEGAALTLRTLLGDPCPSLVEKLHKPCREVQDTILNCIYAHRSYWRCLQLQQTYTMEELNNVTPLSNLHTVNRVFIGGPPVPERFPTRNTAPDIPAEVTARNLERLRALKADTQLDVPAQRVCYAYDDIMLQHLNLFDEGHPEQPKRIKRIYQMHNEYKLLERMHKVISRTATTDEICLAHTRTHVNFIRRLGDREQLQQLGAKYNSVYFHPKTFDCATLAAGSVLQVVDKVLTGTSRSGICIVRPPGHHAEADEPHGFCIFNNVAIAAQYAIRDHALRRVLIVDWDVHHGNGTQHIFETNPNVLYISIHRYENGTFFPKGPDGNFDMVGKGAGVGFNVNIPWNKRGMGDIEYALAFQQIIMPIAYEFDPELVLVSAGFDAAIGDPLGGCKVSPEAYGLFTHWLSALAGGRIIICLEGGYNINSISYAMTMCTKALLGDPLPTVQFTMPSNRPPTVAFTSCIETMQRCLSVQQQYWHSLVFNKRLPEFPNVTGMSVDSATTTKSSMAMDIANENNNEDFLAATMEHLNISNDDVQDVASGLSSGISHDDQEASGSKPKVKVKTLTEFLAENFEAFEKNEMFAVVPRKNCPHLCQLRPSDLPQSINTSGKCGVCQTMIENWICLSCNAIYCGRYVNEHMLKHYQCKNHPLALSFSDLSVWCYKCEAYIDNRHLYMYKNLAHRNKFGEEMPWTYKDPRPKSLTTKKSKSKTTDNDATSHSNVIDVFPADTVDDSDDVDDDNEDQVDDGINIENVDVHRQQMDVLQNLYLHLEPNN